jgi:hypothetical protein
MSADGSIAEATTTPVPEVTKVVRAKSPRSALVIGYGLLVPLVAMAMIVVATYPATGTDAVLRVEITYAVALLSFLGGVRWGIALMAGGAHFRFKPLATVTLVLPFAWLILFMEPSIALGALMAGYVLIAFGERMGKESPVPAWYNALLVPFTVMIEIALGLTLLIVLGS